MQGQSPEDHFHYDSSNQLTHHFVKTVDDLPINQCITGINHAPCMSYVSIFIM